MKVIYVGQTDWDAQMVRDLLVSNGIDAEVRTSHVGTNQYPDQQSGTTGVWILADEDEQRALAIVGGFQADIELSRLAGLICLS